MTDFRLAGLFAATAALALAGCGDNKTATTISTEATAPAAVPEAVSPPETATATTPVAPTLATSVSYAALTGDAARGETIFGQCRTCHVVEQGVNRIGPSLWGVVGRKAGSIEGFRYSAANRKSGLVWTEEQLFTYLEAPQKVLKGTYMAFAGLKKPQDRADVIAYLKTRA